MNDDAELLRRYAEEKSEAAFTELVQRHLGLVYHAALRQCGGDAHRAEDVAQLVFADLARKARQLARRPVLTGWLYTSTRYAAAQAVRTEARRQAREQEMFRMNEALAPHTEPVAEWETLRPVIDDVLHGLNERDREAVLLRFFEGRGFAEMGVRLAMSEDGARMRVERALEKMRAALTRHGITSTTAALGMVLTQQAGAALPAGLATSVAGAALTSAATGGGVSLGFLAFMSANKATVGALAAIAGVLVLNVTQQRANAQLQAEVHALAAENGNLLAARRAAPAAALVGSSGDAAELARLRAQQEELRKKIAARSGALTNGGILTVGGYTITRETPAEEKLEIMYREGRSSPMRAWQTLLTLGGELAKDEKSRRQFVDIDMLALMLCLDDAARVRIDAFLTALPPEVRASFRSPERLVAPVFDRWLWQGDRPRGYGSSGDQTDVYVPGDATRAHSAWRVEHTSGRTEVERFPFKRFDDGWRYGPLSVADAEQMLALLDPRTGQPKAAGEAAR